MIGFRSGAGVAAWLAVGSGIWAALAWCLGILVGAYGIAMFTYHRKIA